MGSELERAANSLFPLAGDSQVGNVKFFRGHRREVTAEELADQLNRADAQVRSGDIKPNTNVDGDLTA